MAFPRRTVSYYSTYQGCARDIRSQDRDKTETCNPQDETRRSIFSNTRDRDETETFSPQDRAVPFFQTVKTETEMLLSRDGDASNFRDVQNFELTETI